MSGEWFGEIPQHWESEKIGALFTERRMKVSDKDYAPLSVAKIGVVPQLETAVKTDAGDNRKLVCAGDFVINSRSDRKGSCGVSKLDGSVSLINIVLTPRGQLSGGYTHYLLRSQPFAEEYYRNGRGIVSDLWTTRYSEMKSIMLPIPPRDEQEQIVRFLDWKVSAINRLINIRHKQITHMEGLEKAVINNAMCKGLYDGVSMKDSGINWIRDIPKHWNIIRCKFLFRERDERSKTGSEQHLSMSQKFGLIPDNQLDERRMMSESYQGGKLCHTDDLVLNRLKAHLGVFAIAPQLGVVSPDYTVLIPNKDRILPSYAETILKSSRCRGELRRRVRGVVEGFWRLYTNDFYNIVLPIPPCKEQNEIMNYIQKLKNKVQNYKSTTVNEIADLEDLKARLISDVVTGKIDVRGVEVPEVEFVDEAAGEEDFEVDNELFGISE